MFVLVCVGLCLHSFCLSSFSSGVVVTCKLNCSHYHLKTCHCSCLNIQVLLYVLQESSTFVVPSVILDHVHHALNHVLCNAMTARIKYVSTAKTLNKQRSIFVESASNPVIKLKIVDVIGVTSTSVK